MSWGSDVLAKNRLKWWADSLHRGRRWPLRGIHLHVLHYWSTSWIRWWRNSPFVFQHGSSGKRHHSLTLLQRGRSSQSKVHETGETSLPFNWAIIFNLVLLLVNILLTKLFPPEDNNHNSPLCFLPMTAHHVSRQSAEVVLFLSWGTQFGKQRVDQRVLDVTEHSHRGIHLCQLLDDQYRREERGASASVFWVNLDTHKL